MRKLFVVCPCFNEEAVLGAFAERLGETLRAIVASSPEPLAAHIVFVDDGSSDRTWEIIASLKTAARDVEVSGLRLSRNFGHQSALCAGLDHAMGELNCGNPDTVIIMDSDGQHPPECLQEMVVARRAGFHHVQMIREDDETSGGLFKRVTSPLFYKLFSWLSGLKLDAGASDFRAFSGAFLRQYLRLTETNRFNRGLFAWMGFKTRVIRYRPLARIAGTSSYTFLHMMRLAAVGITYFSSRPLTLTTGIITGGGFLVCGLYFLDEAISILRGNPTAPGWATTMAVVTLWGSLISLNLWILAAYVARIFDEVKGRPSYLVEDVL